MMFFGEDNDKNRIHKLNAIQNLEKAAKIWKKGFIL